MTSPETKLSWESAAAEKAGELSPFIHEFFMVQVADFRGMAYCDDDGTWRTAYRDEELSGDVCVFE
jgi:hypothetical protein